MSDLQAPVPQTAAEKRDYLARMKAVAKSGIDPTPDAVLWLIEQLEKSGVIVHAAKLWLEARDKGAQHATNDVLAATARRLRYAVAQNRDAISTLP